MLQLSSCSVQEMPSFIVEKGFIYEWLILSLFEVPLDVFWVFLESYVEPEVQHVCLENFCLLLLDLFSRPLPFCMLFERCDDFSFDNVSIELRTQLSLHLTDSVLIELLEHPAFLIALLLLRVLSEPFLPLYFLLVPVDHYPDAERQHKLPMVLLQSIA